MIPIGTLIVFTADNELYKYSLITEELDNYYLVYDYIIASNENWDVSEMKEYLNEDGDPFTIYTNSMCEELDSD